MKKLTEEDLQDLNGAWNVWSCVSQGAGGIGVIGGLAAGLAFASNPVGWVLLGISAVDLVASYISDPYGCEYGSQRY